MACMLHVTNPKSGITYVYRSESYWDKDKKAPRNRRTLVGKIDPDTGNIVETKKRSRKQPDRQDTPLPATYYQSVLEDLNTRLATLTSQLNQLQASIAEIVKVVDKETKSNGKPPMKDS